MTGSLENIKHKDQQQNNINDVLTVIRQQLHISIKYQPTSVFDWFTSAHLSVCGHLKQKYHKYYFFVYKNQQSKYYYSGRNIFYQPFEKRAKLFSLNGSRSTIRGDNYHSHSYGYKLCSTNIGFVFILL